MPSSCAILTYWKNERLNLTNTGIGKMMSMMSVRIFNTPDKMSTKAFELRSSIVTERDQLDLSLATVPRVGNNSPIELERSTFGKRHDLNDHIAGGK
jgi:hypothetical protein